MNKYKSIILYILDILLFIAWCVMLPYSMGLFTYGGAPNMLVFVGGACVYCRHVAYRENAERRRSASTCSGKILRYHIACSACGDLCQNVYRAVTEPQTAKIEDGADNL